MAIARLTGVITNIGNPLAGTSEKGNAWAMTSVTVLVGGLGATEFMYDHTKVPNFRLLQAIDIAVEVGSRNDRPSLRYAGVWDEAMSSLISDTLSAAATSSHAAL